MRNRVFGLVITIVLVLTSVAHAQRQSKCDSKKEVEDAYIPPCGPVLLNGGRICPVLRGSNGMLHPNRSEVWAYPDDERNFEVKQMPRNLTRVHDGCIRPRTGYEWVYPDDPRNFAAKPISGSGSGAAVAGTSPAIGSASVAAPQDCNPKDVPGKHGTTNIYRVPFNGDGRGKGVSQSIVVKFTMFDDGRIEAPLTYENDSKEAFCGGVHIRLGDINNNSIAEFYSDPKQCVNGRPVISLGGGVIVRNVDWKLQTTREVACKYAHLYIVPNHNHAATSPTTPPDPYPWIPSGRWAVYEMTGGGIYNQRLRDNETFWLKATNGRRTELESASADPNSVAHLLMAMCEKVGIKCVRNGAIVAVPDGTEFHVLGNVASRGVVTK